MGLKMPSEEVSIAQEIPLWEPVYLSLRRTMLGNVDLCLERNRILGASVVRYSTGKSSLSWRGENELLSGRDPGFRRNQVVIRSYPGFNLNLRHTNIRLISGLHSNWPSKLLFGRIPSFAVPCTVIWSCPRFQCPLPLFGHAPFFTTSYTVIWSCTRIHGVLYHYLVGSRLHSILEK